MMLRVNFIIIVLVFRHQTVNTRMLWSDKCTSLVELIATNKLNT